MAKKRRRSVCLIDGCSRYRRDGWRVCGAHLAPAALQAEIQRLRDSRDDAWVVLRYPELRTLVDVLTTLERRADSASSNGKLGAALSRVVSCVGDVERIASPKRRPPRPEELVAHCGRAECPKPKRAQRADGTYCIFCGRLMPGQTAPTEAHESVEVAPRASRNGDNADTTGKSSTTVLTGVERDVHLDELRAGLIEAVRISQKARAAK